MNISKASCFISLIFILAAFSVAFSQEIAVENPSEIIQTQTTKVDEFGRLNECAFGARLDNFAVELQSKPESIGYIVAYKSTSLLPSQLEGNRPLRRAQNYLVNTRGIDPARIAVIDGGFRKEETTELWLVPPGAEPPKPSDTVPAPVIPKGKTYLYDKGFFEDVSEFALPVAEDFAPEAAEETADSEETAEAEEAEPEIVNEENAPAVVTDEMSAELTQEESEALKFNWLDERFASLVKNEKKSRGVIIFYADETEYDVNKIRTRVEEGKTKLLKDSGLTAERFEIIFGGYRQFPEIEFWLVPTGGERPVPTPETKQIEKFTEELENSKKIDN